MCSWGHAMLLTHKCHMGVVVVVVVMESIFELPSVFIVALHK